MIDKSNKDDSPTVPELQFDADSVLAVQKLELTDKSLLVLKGPVDPDTAKQIGAGIAETYPDWAGFIMHLPQDVDLEQIPKPLAQALYEQLKEIFDEG